MNRHYRILLILVTLILSALACKALSGDTGTPESIRPQDENLAEEALKPVQEPTTQPAETEVAPAPDLDFETEFPLPDSVINPLDMGGMLNFQTELSLDELLTFYRAAFEAQGYLEREATTVATDTTFSIVFDGHESDRAIVVQAVDLGNGTVNVNIRFEET